MTVSPAARCSTKCFRLPVPASSVRCMYMWGRPPNNLPTVSPGPTSVCGPPMSPEAERPYSMEKAQRSCRCRWTPRPGRDAAKTCPRSTAVLLELPVTVIQRTDLAGLQPSRDAVEMESVIANTPSNGALLAGGGCLVCLALDTEIHDVVSANGAVVDDNVPGPERNGVPLLDLESLLALARGAVALLLCNRRGATRRVGHINICHRVQDRG